MRRLPRARHGDSVAAAALTEEKQRTKGADVDPTAVLLFHGGGLAIFGGFLGGLFLIMVMNGHIPPFDWAEIGGGAKAMVLAIAASFVLEMITFPSMSVAAVQSRVDGAMGRWALLWLLGFAGTFVLAFTGRASAFFGFFAILKAIWEGWGMLARLFGWTSLKERERAAQLEAHSERDL